MTHKVDLNCDLGESFGAFTIGQDEQIIPFVSSVNIACGFHAGDPLVMKQTVMQAKKAGVGIGAHPGFPDLMGFGRRAMVLTPEEVKAYVMYQLSALIGMAKAQGETVKHVKPHGALYNMAATDYGVAKSICEAIYGVDRELILLGLSGSELIRAGKDMGLATANEVFADRGYNEDGTLVARQMPGAFIHDVETAVARVVKMVKDKTVETVTGKEISLQADSICVHGDDAQALDFVRAIKAGLANAGIDVVALSRFIKI